MVQFVAINGAHLAYRIQGPDDAPLMITLHGGRGMGELPHPCVKTPAEEMLYANR